MYLVKCGGDLLGGGTFLPPTEEGSNVYLNNVNCTWRLESSSPNKIGIEFQNFETEPKVDYVKVSTLLREMTSVTNKC